MSDFTKRTQSYTDARLFAIVREAEKYAPEAVTAAEAEIEQRGLQAEDFAPQQEAKPFQRLSGMVDSLALPKSPRRSDDVIDWVEESELESTAGVKYLLYLMIITVLIGLFSVYDQMDHIIFSFGPLSDGFDAIIFIVILALLFQFFLAYLLWRRNHIGYYITACFAIIGLIGNLILVPYFFQRSNGGIGNLIDILYAVNPVTVLSGIVLSTAILWLVTRKELMDIFGISKKNLITTLAIGVAYSVLSYFVFA